MTMNISSHQRHLWLPTLTKSLQHSTIIKYLFHFRYEMSRPVDLEAGLFYYIETVHASKGDKVDEFKVGVLPPSRKSQFPIKKDSLRQFKPSE